MLNVFFCQNYRATVVVREIVSPKRYVGGCKTYARIPRRDRWQRGVFQGQGWDTIIKHAHHYIIVLRMYNIHTTMVLKMGLTV